MTSTSQLTALETLFKALADRTRVRILGLLTSGEVCVCHIQESLGLPQPTVSRHLAYLRRTGLVHARKDGLWVHYRLAELGDPVMQVVLDAALHAIGHLQAAGRDRRRLASRVDVPATAAPRPQAARCCG